MSHEVFPVYDPSEKKGGGKMKIAVLFSGGASAVPFMIGGKTYELVGAISSSKNASGIDKLHKLGIPVENNDIKEFYKNFSSSINDLDVRSAYDKKNISILEEKEWVPDLIACSGYMYILTDDFLDRYYNRIINVHPADLSKLDQNGKKKYTGDDAVRDAMEAGETSTRSTIHIMSDVVDGGPIICMSDELPVGDRTPYEQQELMKEKCDGPAYIKALRLLSEGRVFLDDKDNVYTKTYDSRTGEFPVNSII